MQQRRIKNNLPPNIHQNILREDNKMKITTLYIEAKRSKNFQTFTVGRTITIEEGEDPKAIENQQQHEVNNQAKKMLNDT